jgi:peptide alpha-N-acetyltransferase
MSANDNPQTGQGRFLPKKEADLFKSVVKFYESKQYKKGLKASDAILKKFPNHGETLCMKGLIFNCTDKKEEAHALVKKGLMFDMR